MSNDGCATHVQPAHLLIVMTMQLAALGTAPKTRFWPAQWILQRYA
jgi:hypothetical protein